MAEFWHPTGWSSHFQPCSISGGGTPGTGPGHAEQIAGTIAVDAVIAVVVPVTVDRSPGQVSPYPLGRGRRRGGRAVGGTRPPGGAAGEDGVDVPLPALAQ